MVSKTKARENLEQLQGSLRSSLQEDPMIIKDIEERRICNKCASNTSQCSAFHQDSPGSHPGAGKSRNGNTIQQKLGCAFDKDDLGALDPSRYPNR